MPAKLYLKIVNVDRLNQNLLLVSYSNGTTAAYSAEQITALIPMFTTSVEESDQPELPD